MSVGEVQLQKLKDVSNEARWLCGRGYPAGAVATFVAEHRPLSRIERKLLEVSAASTAQHRHHIARELDAEDLPGRPLRIDVESVVEGVADLIGASRSAEPLVLSSEAGLLFVIEPTGAHSVEALDEAAKYVAEHVAALRPKSVRLVFAKHAEVVAGRLAQHFPEKLKGAVTFDCVPSIVDRLVDAPAVVSMRLDVLDRCGTWVNLPSWIARSLGVRPLTLD